MSDKTKFFILLVLLGLSLTLLWYMNHSLHNVLVG